MGEFLENKVEIPIFSIVAAAIALLSLFTPVLLLSLPVMAAVGLCIVGIVRKEKPIWLPFVVAGFSAMLLISVQTGLTHFWPQGSQATLASNAPVSKNLNWQYLSSKDAMRGTVSKWAVIDSPTELSLSPPYDGPNVASLSVEKGGWITLSVTKGQLLCRHEDTVALKFDDGPVWNYPCGSPENGDSTILYIEPLYDAEKRQLEDPMDALVKAKSIMIEVEFYNDGVRQFMFNVAGLDLSKL